MSNPLRRGPLRHYVSLANATSTPDDTDGMFNDLQPGSVWAAIEPQAPGFTDGTRSITHLITIEFHPQVNLDTRVAYYDDVLLRTRYFFVKGMQNIEERNILHRLLCEEVQP